MMKKEIEINELIESYLKGAISGAEKLAFEKRMQEDPSLAQQVGLHRQLHDIISDSVYLDLKNELKTIHLKKTGTSDAIRRITGFGGAGLIVGLAVFLTIKSGRDHDDVIRESPVVPSAQTAIDTLESEAAGHDEAATEKDNTALSGQKIIVYTKRTDADTIQPDNRIQNSHRDSVMTGAASTSTDETIESTIHKPVQALKELETEPDQETVLNSEKEPETDCSKINIEAIFTGHPSCNNKPTGMIEIDARSIKGGEPPYTFSLNQKTFTDTLIFASLYPGSYPVYAKDAHDCASRVGIAIIESEDCTYQDIFAPLRGEIWHVPVEQDKTGTLLIYSKAGIAVYNISVNGDDPVFWNGTMENGQMLPMGLYQFEIRYDDGTTFTGNVTIVR